MYFLHIGDLYISVIIPRHLYRSVQRQIIGFQIIRLVK